jgi:repressor LexA
MKELTERQKEVLSFIVEYTKKHPYPPTIRELAEFFSISVKGAHDHINALKKKGRIKQTDKRSRTIEILGNHRESPEYVEIPLLGTVAAGRPILSEQNFDGTIFLHPSWMKKGKSYFAVKVKGDSMAGVGIIDGDTAIIEQQQTCKNGEIAVALVNDEAVTLKRIYRENNRIRLEPENPDYQPTYSQNVKILGRLDKIIRSY